MSSYLRTQWRRFFGLNLSPVTPMLFVGGQFEPEQWPQLRALGVRAVLSLQAEREDCFSGPGPERTLRLLVADFTPPTLQQLDEGVRFVAEAHAAGLPVLVHCHAGVGRAPIAAAAFLMHHQALDHQQALAAIREARPIIGPNSAQIQALAAYDTLLCARRAGRDAD